MVKGKGKGFSRKESERKLEGWVSSFNPETPHTVSEWAAYWELFKYSDPTRETAIARCMGNPVMLTNLETDAWLVYLGRKAAKGLVIKGMC